MIEVDKRLLSAEEFYKLAEVGILKPSDNVELVNGEIIEISPVGSKHASVVKRLGRVFNSLFEGKTVIGVQDPVHLDGNNVPEPDISILKYRSDDYEHAHPTVENILLLVEVSDTTIQYDKEIKVKLYAQSLIPIVWIVDINQNRIEVYSNSDGVEFLKKDFFEVNHEIAVLDKNLPVSEILH